MKIYNDAGEEIANTKQIGANSSINFKDLIIEKDDDDEEKSWNEHEKNERNPEENLERTLVEQD